MHFTDFVAASLPILGALAAPRPQAYTCMSSLLVDLVMVSAPAVSTTTVSLTLTITSTHTWTATSSAPSTYPTTITSPSSPFTIISSRSGSSVHLLPVTGSNFLLHLGGETASYCPSEQVSDCPPGTSFVFGSLCSPDVEVPGGQQFYVAPDGRLGYTQAHSASVPEGANFCPFTYTQQVGTDRAYIGLDPAKAFGASSIVACPTADGPYQLFANLANATVPQGDVSQCLGFSAIAEDYSSSPAAWQYT